MNCPRCDTDIRVVSADEGTSYYAPVNPLARSNREIFTIPFCCSLCSALKINYKPVRDVVFVWPYPAPEKVGSIFLPEETDYVGGAFKEKIRPNKAIVLGVGSGYYNVKKKRFIKCERLSIGDVVYYNKSVPWRIQIKDDSGVKHHVTICGFQDVCGFEE